MAGKFSIDAIFSAKDRFGGVMGRIEGRLSRFQSQVGALSRGVGSSIGAMQKRMAPVGEAARTLASVGVAAGAAMAGGLYNVVQAGADLEHTLVGAAAKFSPEFRRGTAEFNELRAAAEKIGSTTEFSATQAAAALKDLGAAGLNAKQGIAVLPGLVDLGTAAEIELSEASIIATKSLGAFNLMTDDTVQLTKNFNRVMDTMARTADLTTSDMAGLFETIKEGGPVAVGTGASIETFLAMAGQLSQAGIDASVAGTTLKNVFLSLSAPSTEAAAALQKLGIRTKDTKGNLRDVIDVLGELQTGTAKMGTADRADTLEQIFGKIPIAGVTSLLNTGTDKIRTMRTELEHAGGSMAKMAGIMRDDTKGDIDRLGKSLDAIRTSIFNVVQGPLTPMIQGLTDWARANKDVIATRVDQFVKMVVPLVTEFGNAFTKALPGILQATQAVLGFMGGDNSAFLTNSKLIAQTLGQVAAAAIGVAAVFGGVVHASLTAVSVVVQGSIGLWDGLVATIGEAATLIGGFFADVGARIDAAKGWGAKGYEIGRAIVLGIVGGLNALVNLPFVAIENMANGIKDRLKGVLGISSPSKVFMGYGKDTVDGFALGLAPMAKTLEEAIPSKLPTFAGAAPAAWGFGASAFGTPAAGGFVPAGAIPPINAPGLGSDQAPGVAPPAGSPALPPSAQAPQADAANQAQLAELLAILKANAEKDGKSVVELRVPQGVQAEVKTPKAGVRNPVRVTQSGGPR